MAPTPRKKSRVLVSGEQKKKSPSLSKKRRGYTDEDSSEKNERRAKFKGAISQCSEGESTTLCSKSSVKPRSDSKRNFSKLNESPRKSKTVQVPNVSVDEMNVQQLLALGEQTNVDSTYCDNDDDFQVSTDSDSDFEEVENANSAEPVIPKEGVNITLEVPSLYGKSKKKGFDLAAHLKRQINRVKRDLQILMHKVHVLCWIAHLRFVNNTLNDPSVLSSCALLLKSKNMYPSKYADLTYLEGILKWFHKNFVLKKDFTDPLCTGGLLEEIKYQVKEKQAFSTRAFIFIFIILLRVVGLKARIVMSFQVLPIKPSLLELNSDLTKEKGKEPNKSKVDKDEEENDNSPGISNEEKVELKSSSKRKSTDNLDNQKKKQKVKPKKEEIQDQTETVSDDEFESKHFRPSIKLGNSKRKKDTKSKTDAESKCRGQRSQLTKNKKLEKSTTNSDEDEDNDFSSKSLIKKNTNLKAGKKANTGKEEVGKKKEGSDIWTEVYLEAEEKWLCVDVPRQKIHCIGEIYSRATHPVVYVIACNNDGTLKDVTKRYVPSWHSDTRKKRVSDDWWNETMKYFLPARTAQDKEEDEDINRQLLDQPLPSSISEFKDHPMYALKRHLLKFEAIYPPDAPTLGFIRGEPVYARECVFTLHSREMWYKQARLVRLKEEPYKIVKARPKYDKMTGEVKKDLPLELFGKWQTEDYIPPVATDGKVPRNEYGNVDLFKPCMLPIGTVHLQIPALNKIAKKLDIDCAPATVGFDFHSGGSHPVFDGFVVCEEFKDVLLDAWNKEIDESSKKEEEKKEKRVYGNWKRLIRGMLIKEKLKTKYAFGENSDEEGHSKILAKASTSSPK